MPGNFSKANGDVETGDDITADLWNSEFDNIITNMTPDGLDDASTDASAMQATRDPYPLSAEDLATSAREELQSLRYQILEISKRFGPNNSETKWYADIPYLFGTKGTDIASAAALTIPSDGNYFDVTGTTAITSIGTKGVGSEVTFRFTGSLVLTHHSTDLVLPGSVNILTNVGDHAVFREYAAGDWRLVNYLSVEKVEPSSDALTLTDGAGNGFSGVATTWSREYIGNRRHLIKINGVFTTHGSATGAALRISGFGLTLNASGTPYIVGSMVLTSLGVGNIFTTPTMVSTSVVSMTRSSGNWATGADYMFTLEMIVPV